MWACPVLTAVPSGNRDNLPEKEGGEVERERERGKKEVQENGITNLETLLYTKDRTKQ